MTVVKQKPPVAYLAKKYKKNPNSILAAYMKQFASVAL
jgi:hypothetical protein